MNPRIGAFALVLAAGLLSGVCPAVEASAAISRQIAKLLPGDPEGGSTFALAVALDGDTALVSRRGFGESPAAVYVFVRDGAQWVQQAKILAPGASNAGDFGGAVALNGDTALISASGQQAGSNYSQGAVYVFARDGSEWTQEALLLAEDGVAGDSFGAVLAMDADTALVVAAGSAGTTDPARRAAYVFTRNEGAWSQQAKLVPDGVLVAEGFGTSAALSGDTALVGARGLESGPATYQGNVRVFRRNGQAWAQEAVLTATSGVRYDFFGTSVALDGDRALIGAPGCDLGPSMDGGCAHVFVRSGEAWTEEAVLFDAGGQPADGFGRSVALEGGVALVGAPEDDVGSNGEQGSALVFARCGDDWGTGLKFSIEDGSWGERFAWPVVLSGDTALLAANFGRFTADANHGAAYLFHVSDGVFADGFEPEPAPPGC